MDTGRELMKFESKPDDQGVGGTLGESSNNIKPEHPLESSMADLKSKLIEVGGFRELSEDEQLRVLELYTIHSKDVSERICKHIESSGVTDFFDTNFWEEFFKAELGVLKEEQRKDIEIVQFMKKPEGGKEVEVNTGKVETAKELYGAVDSMLIFTGERSVSNPIIEYCDSRPRLSKVLPHFLFNSLVSKELTEENSRADFMKLFDVTTQSSFAAPLESKPGQPTTYSLKNESLKEEKRRYTEKFFSNFSEIQKESLFKYIKEWQSLCSTRGYLAQEIRRYGSYDEAEKNKEDTFATIMVADYWSEEYEVIVKKDQLIKGAESILETQKKYQNKQTDAGNIMGHDLAYASRLIEAIEMI